MQHSVIESGVLWNRGQKGRSCFRVSMIYVTGMAFLAAYASILVYVQSLGGIRTDEAKYLLNIPYPHPPLARFLLSLTEWVPFQEMLSRVVFALLLVNAVFLVWDMGRTLGKVDRILLAAAWLLSSGLVLQAGAITMAVLTAVQALIFLWLITREDIAEAYPGWIALLWLVSLFTAYQAVLFAPLVAALFLRVKISWWRRTAYFGIPLLLLILYTLANPLALASMVIHGSRDLDSSVLQRLLGTGKVWALGGSFALSLLGTLGIVLSRRWEVIGTFLLVTAYVALSRYDYYMILFTPLFIAGIFALLRKVSLTSFSFAIASVLLIANTRVTAFFSPPILHPDPSREVMRAIEELGGEGDILIHGSFGHQWQYESPAPVRRFREEFLPQAQALICLAKCLEESFGEQWQLLPISQDTQIQVFVPETQK